MSPAEMQRLLAGFTEETVVVGSRAQARSATESAVPVDVLSATDLVSQGAGDLKDQLAHDHPVVQHQHPADQRRLDGGPPRHAPQPGPGPHAGRSSTASAGTARR